MHACLGIQYEAYQYEMYLVQGPLCLEISLICATFVTIELALEGEKATQRRAFKILWNLVSQPTSNLSASLLSQFLLTV